MKFTGESVSGHLKVSHGLDLATYETNYMEEQDWAGEVEELPAIRRESSNHSFDSESLPGELVIAELEPLGAVQVSWREEGLDGLLCVVSQICLYSFLVRI